MKGKSLRALAKELGGSHSYLSQVKTGKRPASEKVLTTLLTSGLIKNDFVGYNEATWQRSSVVEQGTHKPLVVGSNPSAATFRRVVCLTRIPVDIPTTMTLRVSTSWDTDGGRAVKRQGNSS